LETEIGRSTADDQRQAGDHDERGEWLPAHRTSDAEITSGFFRLSDPDYAVVEMDLDGATLKAFNFVQGIQRANTEMRTADTPTHYGVPSLRSAVSRWPRPATPFRCTRTGRTTTVSTPPSRRPRPRRSRSTSRTSHRVTGSMSGQRRGVGVQLCARTGAKNPGSAATGSDRRRRSWRFRAATRVGSSPRRPRARARAEPRTRRCTCRST